MIFKNILKNSKIGVGEGGVWEDEVYLVRGLIFSESLRNVDLRKSLRYNNSR